MAFAAKKVLRKELKHRLLQLSDHEKIRQSQVVTKLLLESQEYKTSKRISVFLSMHDEIKTDGILKHILSNGKHCFIPRYIGNKMDMLRLYSLEDYDSLPETAWKIKQPADDDTTRENALETGGLDLILMPGLGFTRKGDRLGRGKGYYDNYLRKCKEVMQRSPLTVALAFHEQMCEEIPTTESDVPIYKVLFDEKNVN